MQRIEHQRLTNIRNLKLNYYRALIEILTNFYFLAAFFFLPKLNKRCRGAKIISLKVKRVEALDFLINRLFEVFILVDEKAFSDSANVKSTIFQVVLELQEYPIMIAAAKAYATLLQA